MVTIYRRKLWPGCNWWYQWVYNLRLFWVIQPKDRQTNKRAYPVFFSGGRNEVVFEHGDWRLGALQGTFHSCSDRSKLTAEDCK